MLLIRRLNRAPVYLPALLALVLMLTGLVVQRAMAVVPDPQLLHQYDIRTCTAVDIAHCDPASDPPPGTTEVNLYPDVVLGDVHHLDVDGDGGGSGTCGDPHGLGENVGHCDANPDITVRLFIDASGTEMAPVARIQRAPSAIVENRAAPNTRVDLFVTVRDTAGVLPDFDVSFGYATPPGGTIPTKVSAYVLGLLPLPDADASFVPYNPMTLVVDTGQFTTLSGAAPVAPTYAGPLTITGSFAMPAYDDNEAIELDLELDYMPMPEEVRVTWSHDETTGQHLTYEHDAPGTHVHFGEAVCNPATNPPVPGCPRDVDVDARIRSTSGDAPDPLDNEFLQVDARIDRIPTQIDVDIDTLTEEGARNQGTLDLTVPSAAILPSGRLPDARFHVLSRVPNDGPDAATYPTDVQVVTAHVEQLPTAMHAEWYVPEEPGCATVTTDLPPDVTDPCLSRAEFDVPSAATTQHVGAVELRVANHEGVSSAIDPFLPGWDQYVNLQAAPSTPGSARLDEVLTARVERIRNVVFEELPSGFAAHTELGDGAAPLQLHVDADRRTVASEDDPGIFGTHLDADVLVAPLPDVMDLTVQPPDEDAGLPLEVDWNASSSIAPSIDIDGRIEVRGQPAADGADCGAPHTLCATIDIDHLPDVGTLTLAQSPDETEFGLDTSSSIDESFDIVADITARPCAASAPIVARLDIDRVPEHIRARTLTPILEGDPDGPETTCAIDTPDAPPAPDAPVRGLTRFEVQPCDFDFVTRICAPATQGAFGAITVSARNFLERPTELPHVPIVTTPMYTSAAVRPAEVNLDADATDDDLFEVEARLLEVRELQFLSNGPTIGARVRAGEDDDGDGAGNDPFTIAFDLEDVLLDKEDPEAHRTDLSGHVLIENLPTDVDLCYRSPDGEFTDVAFSTITAPCEVDDPFGADTPVSSPPTSFALDTSAEFSLNAALERIDRGVATFGDGNRHDDQTVRVDLGVTPVPSDGFGGEPDLLVHLQTPEEDADGGAPSPDDPAVESDTAVRLQFDATAPSEPITVDFAAEILDDELFCTDPRLPDEVDPDPETGERQFQSAMCMSGQIVNLPTHVQMLYDPETEGQNFRFEHDGADVDLLELRLTSVSAQVDEGFDGELGTGDDAVIPDILVAEGELQGLPELIKGTIVPPGSIVLRSVDKATEDPDDPSADQAGAPVEHIEVTARNFIAPDPMPGVPEQRTPEAGPLPDPDHQILVFRRDELFKATIAVGDLVKAGFETQRDADGEFLDTNIMTVDFGQPDDVVRGFADLQMPTEDDDPATTTVDEAQESLAAVIADVTLRDKPAGVTVCIRGEDPDPSPPVDPVYCDDVDDDSGAVQVKMRPFATEPGDDPPRLDIDAFLRLAREGGGDVLSATAHIDNMPLVVQGTFGDGGADFEGLDLDGVPQGIDAFTFELANFDLHDDAAGYGDDKPWSSSVDGPGWDLAEGDADQAASFSREPLGDYFARLRGLNDVLFAQGAFGVVDDDTTPDSNIQRVSFSPEPCTFEDGPPDDFPHYPRDVNSDYKCVRGVFQEHLGGAQDPLFVEIVIDEDGDRLSLNGVQPQDSNNLAEAGLSRLPHEFRATIADTVTLNPDSSLRDPCGSHLDHASNDESCMPPMLRLDIEPVDPAEPPAFFGMMEMGLLGHLRQLRGALPMGTIAGAAAVNGAGLAEPPGADGFASWPDGHGGRLRVRSFPQQDEVDDGVAVIMGLHVPLHGSLTLDQLQKWSCVNGPDCPGTTAQVGPGGKEADNSDLRLRYVARDTAGETVDTIGQMALMVIDEEGKQILLADPDDPNNAGISLPGEFGLQMYKRDRWQGVVEDAQKNDSFIQLDGRASEEIRLGARIFDEEGNVVHAKVRGTNPIADGDTDPLNPTFRLRALVNDNVDVEEAEDCTIWVVFNMCTTTDMPVIDLALDFLGASRVDAYVTTDGVQNAVEIRGYDVLNGTADADEAPINIDVATGLDVVVWIMIPVIFNFLAVLDISAEMDVDTAERFRWKNQMLAMEIAHDGAAGGADVDIDIIPAVLFGLLVIPIPLLTVVWGFAYVWIPTVGPEMAVNYKECHTFDIGIDEFSVDAGESSSVYADPSIDPRVVQFGLSAIEPLLKTIVSLGGLIGPGRGFLGIVVWFMGCAAPGAPDLPVIADGVSVQPPSTPDHHDVPGFEGEPPVENPLAPAPETPQDLTIDGTVALCGTQIHHKVTVVSGGTLRVATGGDCPDPEDAGTLLLIAADIDVVGGGTIDLTAASEAATISANTLTLSAGGAIRGGIQPVVIDVIDLLHVTGEITADAVRSTPSYDGSAAPNGNSGAGHGGVGGNGGASGAGGAAYGNVSLTPNEDTGLVPLEPGSRGAGSAGTPGDGGGQLHLSAAQIRISGRVSAEGGDGQADAADASRQCAVEDDPDVEGDQSEPNDGLPGPGGGSGGTVVVRGQRIDVTGGVLSVAGGRGANGKAGGGGGGGGGHLKVVTPLYVGSAPDRTGGAGGTTSGCSGPSDPGGPGGPGHDGPDIEDRSPSSRLGQLVGTFFNQGTELDIPLVAAAASGTSGDFQVQLCGLYRPPEAIVAADPADAEEDFGIDEPNPASQTLASPCGEPIGDTSVHDLGHESFPDTTLTADGETIRATYSGSGRDITALAGSGFWGLYSVVAKPQTSGNDCFDHADMSGPFVTGLQFDVSDCALEGLPVQVDTIIGIDNDPPDIGSASIATNANGAVSSTGVQLSIADVTDAMAHSGGGDPVPDQSGVERIECRNQGASDWERCGVGTIEWDLTPGSDGTRTVEVRAIDIAGNVSAITEVTVDLDITAPTFQLALVDGTAGTNDWYLEPPSLRLDTFADAASGPGDPVTYEYWFNGGSHRNCLRVDLGAPPVCHVTTGLPTLGVHRVSAVAIDSAGHRSDPLEDSMKVDGEAPKVELLTAPFEPDAENGWFGREPVLVVNGLDQPFGSGLEPFNDDPTTDLTTGVFYAVDATVDGAPAIPLGDFNRSDAIFDLPAGTHEVCYYATDQAGNMSRIGDTDDDGDIDADDTAGPVCETVLVDNEDPEVVLTAPPIDGDNGWYVTPPTITVAGSDASSGVGDTGTQCAPLATATGVCTSSNLEAYVPGPSGDATSFGIEGRNSLRAFATDTAGKRSGLAVLEVPVDLTDPLTTVRTQPPAPARNDRFRVEPEVHLSAQEPHLHNSGVALIEYCLEDNDTPATECIASAFTTYTGPFLVTDGDWDLRYRAVDEAGRVEVLRTEPVHVDTTAPTVDSTTPLPTPPATYNHVTDPPATLRWTTFDELSTSADVEVMVFGTLPAIGYETLRRLPAQTVNPSTTVNGTTTWDGTRERMAGSLFLEPVLPRAGQPQTCPLPPLPCLIEDTSGPLPLAGRYWYRVVVTDAAGNVAQSDQGLYVEVSLV